MKPIQEYLEEIGLTPFEAKLYMGLLELGATTIKDLSEHVGIKRITVHYNVENLIKKGLVSQNLSGSRRQIFAESPEQLSAILKKRFDRLKRIEDKMPDMLRVIYSSIPSALEADAIKAKYYEGRESVARLYRLVLSSNISYSFLSLNSVFTLFPENEKLFLDAMLSNPKMELWEIIDFSGTSTNYINELNDRYHYRFVPDHVKFEELDIMIFDDKVAMVNLDKNNLFGILINSPVMARGMIAVHKLVWNILPEPPSPQKYV